MGRPRSRMNGKYYLLYLDLRLWLILKTSAKEKGISINTLITQELGALYLDK